MEYTVTGADTLQLIAMKFDVTVDWIKKTNELFSDMVLPGDVLIIKPMPAEAKLPSVIQTGLYDMDTDCSIPGMITISDSYMTFRSLESSGHLLDISFIGFRECGILPHPAIEKILDGAPDDNTLTLFYIVSSGITYLFELPRKLSQLLISAVNSKASKVPQHQVQLQEKELEPIKPLSPELPNQPPKITAEPEKPVSQERKSTAAIPVQRKRVRVREYELPIELVNGPSQIITVEQSKLIRKEFPPRFRAANWRLLYQLSRDGCSYRTFWELTERADPIVLVLKNNRSEVIGTFASAGIKQSRKYYGSGETFIFSFYPEFKAYHWAHTNEYFTCSTEKEIAIGGGGSSAIWIDGHFYSAFSEKCGTFQSPSLTKEPNFTIVDLEVWKIGA